MADRQRVGDGIAGAQAGVGRRRLLDLQDRLHQLSAHLIAGKDVAGAKRADAIGVLQARRVCHHDTILVDGGVGNDAGDDDLRLGARLDAVKGGRDLLATKDDGRVHQVSIGHDARLSDAQIGLDLVSHGDGGQRSRDGRAGHRDRVDDDLADGGGEGRNGLAQTGRIDRLHGGRVRAAAVAPFHTHRPVTRLRIVAQRGLVGEQAGGRDGGRDAQDDGQRDGGVIVRDEGVDGRQLVDTPDQIARGARNRRRLGRHTARAIAAGKGIAVEAGPSRDGVGDDQVVAYRLPLVGNGQRVGDQIAGADRAAGFIQPRHQRVVEVGAALATGKEADRARGPDGRCVGDVKRRRTVDIDAEAAAGHTHFDMVPAIEVVVAAGGAADRRRAAIDTLDHIAARGAGGIAIPAEPIVLRCALCVENHAQIAAVAVAGIEHRRETVLAPGGRAGLGKRCAGRAHVIGVVDDAPGAAAGTPAGGIPVIEVVFEEGCRTRRGRHVCLADVEERLRHGHGRGGIKRIGLAVVDIAQLCRVRQHVALECRGDEILHDRGDDGRHRHLPGKVAKVPEDVAAGIGGGRAGRRQGLAAGRAIDIFDQEERTGHVAKTGRQGVGQLCRRVRQIAVEVGMDGKGDQVADRGHGRRRDFVKTVVRRGIGRQVGALQTAAVVTGRRRRQHRFIARRAVQCPRAEGRRPYAVVAG